MSRLHIHPQSHLVSRIGWLRAAVLGAKDGIVSTASLVVGMAASCAATSEVLVAGVAGRMAAAMSMAAGKYVSVSSQSETQEADLARERAELATQLEFEREERAQIYIDLGVSGDLAHQVADQLMVKDALGTHTRDELGISEVTAARMGPGSAYLGGDLRRRRRDATGDGLADAATHAGGGRVGGIASLSCSPWCRGSPGGWGVPM